ncbi:hypothetical protein [Brevibacillus daliensis]|uniref:hypothetical protein n=1 Tax=Brevibacillus daliensis TaxID=2892995 RepID=UPI001E64E8B5|nr:hypothetical protein [Brevibacillus daliensis]
MVSLELRTMVEELQEDKERYTGYLVKSEKSLDKLIRINELEHSESIIKLIHDTKQEMEALQKLVTYIEFKIKLLQVKEYAS